jgi:hypothetical protein
MKRKKTLWSRITEQLPLVALRLDYLRIGWRLSGHQADTVARFAAYYRARIPGLKLRPNPINGDLTWAGRCPVCQLKPIWVTPREGQWVCEGVCSSDGIGKSPEQLEYLLSGEDCEATVLRLMARAT